MDCFYAAVELRERPEFVGRPVAVGGGSRRGVVTTCNYEARAFGVRSAMPGFMARERCPQIVFLPLRFDLYREVSQQVRAILHRQTDLVEPLSLDEAYLDVTAGGRFAWEIAREIRAQVLAETGLTASAGVASNKMLAKIASDWRKPNGQFAILPADADAFIRDLPVRKLWGVGPKSAERFAAEGIHICADLQRISRGQLAARHGRWGEELYRLCRGIDERPVEPHRERKSLSNEATFGENLSTFAACRKEMEILADELLLELRKKAAERVVRKAFVKIKYADFTRTTHECVCAQPTVEKFVELLAAAHSRRSLPVRLLGSGVRFADETHGENPQLDLFT